MSESKKSIFEFAVHDGEQIIVDPTVVMARDKDHADRLAVRAIPTDSDVKIEDVVVVVRPFGNRAP